MKLIFATFTKEKAINNGWFTLLLALLSTDRAAAIQLASSRETIDWREASNYVGIANTKPILLLSNDSI